MEFYILTQVMFIWGMQEMGIDTDYLLLEEILACQLLSFYTSRKGALYMLRRMNIN